MKRLASLLPVVALLGACADAPPTEPDALFRPVLAAAASNAFVPIALSVFIPCAAGGAGEIADLSGTLHLLTHVRTDNAGGLHVKVHAQPQGISGTGRTTGDKYQGTGVTQQSLYIGAATTFTFVNNFRMIGQGPDNNLLVHQNVHMTINANGDVTADVDNFSVECR